MLDERTKFLCQGKNFAALTTLFEDGQPQTQVMWVDCDDDHVLINTEVGRAKFENITRDPRVAVMIWDSDNAYSYVEVRGKVVASTRGPEARAHIDELSKKYMGQDYPGKIETERVILKIQPDRELIRT